MVRILNTYFITKLLFQRVLTQNHLLKFEYHFFDLLSFGLVIMRNRTLLARIKYWIFETKSIRFLNTFREMWKTIFSMYLSFPKYFKWFCMTLVRQREIFHDVDFLTFYDGPQFWWILKNIFFEIGVSLTW